jgi:toxin YhaV
VLHPEVPSRAKGPGLPDRYRLFWVFSEAARTIIFLYLNDEASLRKAGAKSDPYAVFGRMVARPEVGSWRRHRLPVA